MNQERKINIENVHIPKNVSEGIKNERNEKNRYSFYNYRNKNTCSHFPGSYMYTFPLNFKHSTKRETYHNCCSEIMNKITHFTTDPFVTKTKVFVIICGMKILIEDCRQTKLH